MIEKREKKTKVVILVSSWCNGRLFVGSLPNGCSVPSKSSWCHPGVILASSSLWALKNASARQSSLHHPLIFGPKGRKKEKKRPRQKKTFFTTMIFRARMIILVLRFIILVGAVHQDDHPNGLATSLHINAPRLPVCGPPPIMVWSPSFWGFPLVFLWFSYGFLWLFCLVFLWFS